jgi:hypothetical protein
VYAVNYETAGGVTGLTVGQNISGVTGSCFKKSLPLLYNVCSIEPQAINDFSTTLKNTSVTGSVATNDITNGYGVSFALVSTSPNGSLTLNPDGTFSFTPVNGFVGQVDYLYKICNVAGVCDTAKLSITVFEPTSNNDKPVANDDVAQTNKNVPVSGNVLSNDFDPDGDALQVNSIPVTPPQNGTLLLNPDGSFTYTPNLNFIGKDSFEYVVCDPANLCDVAKVVIYVNEDSNGGSVNDRPNAQDDVASTYTNIPVSGSLRHNDSDPNGPNTTLIYATTPVTSPNHGSVAIAADGTFTYTPNTGFYGNDRLTYRVCDPQGLCDTATLYINVMPPVPDAVNDINLTVVDRPAAGNVLTNDTGNGLPIDLTTSPIQNAQNGSFTLNPDGSYVYVPNTGFVGTETIRYKICNPANLCDTATLTITIAPKPDTLRNNPPIAQNDVVQTFMNTQTTGSVIGNDSDPDGDALVVTTTPLTPPIHGSLTLSANGDFVYLPDPNYTGKDSFRYQVCDSRGECATAWAFIDVKNDVNGSANDRPNAQDDAYITDINTTVYGTMDTNDSDPNNNTLTYATTPVSVPTNGTVTINSNGSFSYKPNTHFVGNDKFVYRVCDNGSPSLCDTATVYISVNPNRPPVVIDTAALTVLQDSVNQICTPITDMDNSDTHTATVVCNPKNGTATPSVIGNQVCVTYRPATNFIGMDTLCVAVCDNNGACDTVRIFVNVVPNTACKNIYVKVLLEGPYNIATGKMNTILNQRGLLPGQTPVGPFAIPSPAGQPFRAAPWFYLGSENVVTYPTTVVDWVLVSFRTSPVLGATTFRAAGLLHEDGTITFPNPCITLPNGLFYVVIEHRNHMGVMSPSAVAILGNTLNFDFTTGESFLVTNPPSFGQKLKGGKWMMYAGDGMKNTQSTNFDINFSDSQLWKTESGIFDQYRFGDFNMDADVNFLDSQLWKLNNGRYSGVPH